MPAGELQMDTARGINKITIRRMKTEKYGAYMT